MPPSARKNLLILGMTADDIDRFWSCVDKSPGQGPRGECHGWTKSKSKSKGKSGYGRFYIESTGVGAHRVAFFVEHGVLPDPETPFVLHTCDFRPCVRGRHLFQGTKSDNSIDMCAKGRGPTRLTDADIKALCELRATTDFSLERLGRLFRVSSETVRKATIEAPMTVSEAAKILCVDPATVRRAINSGHLKARRRDGRGQHWYEITPAALAAYRVRAGRGGAMGRPRKVGAMVTEA